MTDETLNPPVADADAQRKAELMAEGERHGLKFDKRYSVKRMEDLLAEKKGGAAAKAVTPEEPKPAPVAKPSEPDLKPTASSKGMLTTMDMTLPGDLERAEDERRILMERATSLGIANEIRPGANADAVRDHIMRHVANKANEMRQREELDKRRAAGAVIEKVSVRVLRLGDGKISKGIHVPGVGDACFVRGDIIDNVERKRADELELNGMVEIVGG